MPPFSEDVVVLPSVCDRPFIEIEQQLPGDGTSPLPLHQRSDSSNTSALETKHQPLNTTVRRSVSFYAYGEVVDIDTLDEYTDAEIQACWYDEDEISVIKSENQQTIRRFARGVPRPDDCLRGLESQLHAGYLSSRKIKDNSIVAVLSEQYKQHQMSTWSPELIRECYIHSSRHSANRAVEAAKHDAFEATKIQKESPPVAISARPATTICWFLNPASWFPRVVDNALMDMEF